MCGHTRYQAAKRLNLDTIPIIKACDLTPAQEKAYRIADNKTSEYSKWDNELLSIELETLQDLDFDLDLTGFEEWEIAQLFTNEEYEPINDEGYEKTMCFEYKLKCGEIEVVLSAEEYKKLLEAYNNYTRENGVSFGFVGSVLNG